MLKDYIHTIRPLSRGLPKTGQVISYVAGDDGEHEVGWWLGMKNGINRKRFVVKTLDGCEVVIDLATGLMWIGNTDDIDCGCRGRYDWGSALTNCSGLEIGGFNNWRLPNINELASIVNWSTHSPAIYDVFTNTAIDDGYFSSTTRIFLTTYAKVISYSEGTMLNGKKVDAYYVRAVRVCV